MGGYHDGGDILSTVVGVQYRGGYHEYRGGCSVPWGEMHVGGYHEYRGNRGGRNLSTVGGYHDRS